MGTIEDVAKRAGVSTATCLTPSRVPTRLSQRRWRSHESPVTQMAHNVDPLVLASPRMTDNQLAIVFELRLTVLIDRDYAQS